MDITPVLKVTISVFVCCIICKSLNNSKSVVQPSIHHLFPQKDTEVEDIDGLLAYQLLQYM